MSTDPVAATGTGAVSGSATVANTGVVQGSITVHAGGHQFTADGLAAMHPRRAAELVAGLPVDQAVVLLATTDPRGAAGIVDLMTDEAAITVLLAMHPDRARAILRHRPTSPLAQVATAAEAIELVHRRTASLGDPVSPLALSPTSPRGQQGFQRRFDRAVVYWTPATGPVYVVRMLADRHAELGGTGGTLGFPVDSSTRAPDGPNGEVNARQRFEGPWDYPEEVRGRHTTWGATVYASAHGIHATWGGIGVVYERSGGPAGPHGFPISGEVTVTPPPGATEAVRQDFEYSSIYWSDTTDVITVPKRVVAVLPEDAFPASLEQDVGPSPQGTTGVRQRFTSPSGPVTVYLSRHGAHAVDAETDERFGGPRGVLGFPLGAPTSLQTVQRQAFEGGATYWTSGGLVGMVPNPIAREHIGYIRDRVGLPVSEASPTEDGGLVQFFEHGVATVRAGKAEFWRPVSD